MAFHVTTSHDAIRSWIEGRGGSPAVVKGVPGEVSADVLSIRFGDDPELEQIGWEEFFDVFDTSNLSFRYTDGKDDHDPRSYNFVSRDLTPQLNDGEFPFPEDNDMVRENTFPSMRADEVNLGDVQTEQ